MYIGIKFNPIFKPSSLCCFIILSKLLFIAFLIGFFTIFNIPANEPWKEKS